MWQRLVAKESATDTAFARSKNLLEKLVKKILGSGRGGTSSFCNEMEEQFIEKYLQDIIQAFGKLDVRIANGGGGVMGKIEKLSAEEWDL